MVNNQIKHLLNDYNNLNKKQKRQLISDISELIEQDLDCALQIFNEFQKLFEIEKELNDLIEEIEEKCKKENVIFDIKKPTEKTLNNEPLPDSLFLRKENSIDLYLYPVISLTEEEKIRSKVILVVGQTGSGKTTLLNSYVNYLMQIKATDSFRYLIIDEPKGLSQAHSQTSTVNHYFIRPKIEDYPVVVIVDTPGFGDTRGVEQDNLLMGMIEEAFKYKIDSLTAVCFVAQSSNARLTANQRYIFNRVLELFGDDIKENILAMLTFCDGSEPQVLSALKEKGSVFDQIIPHLGNDWYYKFNNSAVFCKIKDTFNQLFWELGMDSFEKFSSKLKTMNKKSLDQSREVLKERRTLEELIPCLQKALDICLVKMNSIKRLIEQIKDAKSKIDSTKDFKLTINEPKIDKVYTGKITTHCNSCNYTCHESCCFENDSDKDKCSAMKNLHCVVCPQRCHYTQHNNIPYNIVHSTIKKTITIKELEEKYYDSRNSKSKFEQILENTETEFDMECIRCFDTQETLKNSIDRLKQIALNKNSFQTSEEYIDLMIISEKDQKKDGYQARIESLCALRSCHKTMRELYENGDKKKQDFEKFKRDMLEEKKKLMIHENKKEKSSCMIF